MGVESFAALSGKQEDVLRKKFCYGALALLAVRSQGNGKVFKARVAQLSDSEVKASTSLQVAHNFTPKLRSDGTVQLTVDYEASPQLKLTGDLTANSTRSESDIVVSGEYSTETAKTKVALTYPNSAKVTTTIGKERYGLGLDVKYDFTLKRFVSYNFLQYWFREPYRLVFKILGSNKTEYALGDLVYSYFHKTSEKTTLAANWVYNWPRQESYIEFGGVYQYAPDIELRGKLDSQGLVSVGISKEISSVAKLSLASQIDAKKAAHVGVSDYKLGLRLDLNL